MGDSFAAAKSVFKGTVSSITPDDPNTWNDVTFTKISDIWKGEVKDRTIVKTRGSNLCGYDFVVGRTYIVYANANDRVEGGCTGMTGSADKQHEANLYKLATPEDITVDTPEDMGPRMYGIIQSDDAYDISGSACIAVKGGKAGIGRRLVLGDCESPGNGWRLSRNGLFRTELDDSLCMQAGHNESSSPMDRAKIRLKPCDRNNNLQKFVFINGNGIRPKMNQSLCMVWKGKNADVGMDPIMLRPCNLVDSRNDWSGDFPIAV
eukprot:CAMPEP_0195519268 /NCGR_PEP_ID=MMETSP0794_2-20130614/14548_1 /TAXON_ID=515487 /ORGANISM="Stephanopyxis turris, Strain CCMP 815" /LENGTH=262 /DNA_ID=CAMNT_0040648391 /DNA_START=190 /DNA_END=978 /DNA_ORIENTATION=+